MLTTASFTSPFTPWERIPDRPPEEATWNSLFHQNIQHLFIAKCRGTTHPRSTDSGGHENSLAPPTGELLILMAPNITTLDQSITTSMSWTGHISDSFQIQHPLDRQTSPISRSFLQERCSRPVALPLQHLGAAWRMYVMINGLM